MMRAPIELLGRRAIAPIRPPIPRREAAGHGLSVGLFWWGRSSRSSWRPKRIPRPTTGLIWATIAHTPRRKSLYLGPSTMRA
jgi:hypothetical protein